MAIPYKKIETIATSKPLPKTTNMKPAGILLLLLFMALPMWSQSTTDEEAIREVIEAETQHWINRNFDDWAATWQQDDKIFWLPIGSAEPQDDWLGLSTIIQKNMQEFPGMVDMTFVNKNYNINTFGQTALVHFQQSKIIEEEIASKTHETRHLVKDNSGNWKITTMITVLDPAFEKEPNLENVLTNLREGTMLLVEMSEPDKALAITKTIRDIYPDHVAGYWGTGWVYMRKGDKENALKYLEKAATMEPDDPDLKNLIATVQKM